MSQTFDDTFIVPFRFVNIGVPFKSFHFAALDCQHYSIELSAEP